MPKTIEFEKKTTLHIQQRKTPKGIFFSDHRYYNTILSCFVENIQHHSHCIDSIIIHDDNRATILHNKNFRLSLKGGKDYWGYNNF